MRAVANDEKSEFDALAFFCLLLVAPLCALLCSYIRSCTAFISACRPEKIAGFSFANYLAFFSDPYQYGTVWITFSLAVPTTIIVLLLALWLAYGMRRGIFMERTVTTILILPISLGVILLSEGILGFYGSQGWLNQILLGSRPDK